MLNKYLFLPVISVIIFSLSACGPETTSDLKPTQPISEEEEVVTEDETGITPALEKEVTFPDSGLEAAIREAIDKPIGPHPHLKPGRTSFHSCFTEKHH